MAEQKSADLRPRAQAILAAAKSFRKTLSQFRTNDTDSTSCEARFNATGGSRPGQPPEFSACTFIIKAETADDAFALADNLIRQNQGCTCVSSGPTEVTCTCPD
jgi:hypothetical protein